MSMASEEEALKASVEEPLKHILLKDQWQEFALSNCQSARDSLVRSNSVAHGGRGKNTEGLVQLRNAHCYDEHSSWIMKGNSQVSYKCTAESSSREVSPKGSEEDIRLMRMYKANILFHPLFEQLLKAHVACFLAATPVEHSQVIDLQLCNKYDLAADCHVLGCNVPPVGLNKQELDCFMVSYISLLQSFREQLQHVCIRDARAALWEIEQAFVSVTGVSPKEANSDNDGDIDAQEFEPTFDTETKMSLMERVRKELKIQLKQSYRSKLLDIREEIQRKRRVGQLPSMPTSVLKKWWDAHSNWPYPMDDEKEKLVQETGLELQQINNWFLNQRKRHWRRHSMDK